MKLSDFAWTRGKPAEFASSSLSRRFFCANCGTPLAFHYDDAETISPTLGSLDHPEQVPPVRHYGIESRVGWLDRLNELPVETTQQAMSTDRAQRFVSHQHPDHDTPESWTPHR